MEHTDSKSRHEQCDIELQHCGIVDTAALQLPKAIQSLSLHCNAIAALGSLQSLTSLTSLYIGLNIVSNADPLSSLVHLKVLDISENRLQKFDIGQQQCLKVLNLAGNGLRSGTDLAGIQSLPSLTALSLARNNIHSEDALKAIDGLQLQLLSLFGNPLTGLANRGFHSNICRRWPSLLVLDAEGVDGKIEQAASLLASLPEAANLGTRLRSATMQKIRADARVDPLQAGTSTSHAAHPGGAFSNDSRDTTETPCASFNAISVTNMAGSPAVQDAPADLQAVAQEGLLRNSSERPQVASLRAHDSAQEGQGADLLRRASTQILDSADDMTEGGQSSARSVSQFGDEPTALDVANAFVPGLVERQDSANYQPRPPALAERQDSAQNLQALAEAEAELAAGAQPEQPLSRQDSAHELDDAARSPSPPVGASRSLPVGRRQSLRISLAESSSRTGQPVLDLSPRHDSATERPLMTQRSNEGSVRSPSRMPFARRQPGAHSLPDNVGRTLLDARDASAHHRGDSASDPLADARRLVQAEAPLLTPRAPGGDAEEIIPRQDSALDSLAEARMAVLGELARHVSNPLPTSDPLVRARMLVLGQGLRGPSSSAPILPGLASAPQPMHLQDAPQGSLLQARSSLPGPESPFDRGLTPLSPRWTLAHLSSGSQNFSQTLPRISSGVPWTPSGSQPSSDAARSYAEEGALAGSGASGDGLLCASSHDDLLAEARRVVLGDDLARQKSADVHYNPFANVGLKATLSPFGQPSPRGSETASMPAGRQGDVSAARNWPTESLSGRHSATIRETPYPDSPLAAGEEGSRQEPTFFQHQMAGFEDNAESSAAAAARVRMSGDSHDSAYER